MNAYVLAFTDEAPLYESGNQIALKGISSGKIYSVLAEDLIFYRPASPVLYGEDKQPPVMWTEEDAVALRRMLERGKTSNPPPQSLVPDRNSPPPSPSPKDTPPVVLLDEDEGQGPASITLELQYDDHLKTSITVPYWDVSRPICLYNMGIYAEAALTAALAYADRYLAVTNVQRVVTPMLGKQLRQNVGLVSYKKVPRKGADVSQMRTKNPDDFPDSEQGKDLMRSANMLEAEKFYALKKSDPKGPDPGFSLQVMVQSLSIQYPGRNPITLLKEKDFDASRTEPLTQSFLKKGATGALYILRYFDVNNPMFQIAFLFLHKHLIGVYVWRVEPNQSPEPEPAAPSIGANGDLHVKFAYDDPRVTAQFANSASVNWSTDTPVAFVSSDLADKNVLQEVFSKAEDALLPDKAARHDTAVFGFDGLYLVTHRFASRPAVHLVADQFYFQEGDRITQLVRSNRNLDRKELEEIGTVEIGHQLVTISSASFETDVAGVWYAPVYLDKDLVALYVWSTARSKRSRIKNAIQ